MYVRHSKQSSLSIFPELLRWRDNELSGACEGMHSGLVNPTNRTKERTRWKNQLYSHKMKVKKIRKVAVACHDRVKSCLPFKLHWRENFLPPLLWWPPRARRTECYVFAYTSFEQAAENARRVRSHFYLHHSPNLRPDGKIKIFWPSSTHLSSWATDGRAS